MRTGEFTFPYLLLTPAYYIWQFASSLPALAMLAPHETASSLVESDVQRARENVTSEKAILKCKFKGEGLKLYHASGRRSPLSLGNSFLSSVHLPRR